MIYVIIIIAILDRIQEFTQFGRWFDNSIFDKIKNERLKKWCRSKAVDKWLPFGKFTPPQIYDLYHLTKGLMFLSLIVYHCIESGWYWFFTDAIMVYMAQMMLEGDDAK